MSISLAQSVTASTIHPHHIRMLDVNSVLLGTCLFVASFGFPSMFRRLPIRQLKSVIQMSTTGAPKFESRHGSNHITLVDLLLPAKDNEIIQNLMNDEIISNSVIGGSLSCKKFYICIHKPEAASTSQVLNYISKLYSKVWNEAALKNIFDIQCCVVSDALEGIITRDQILQHENLTRVMTFDTSHGVELNENRRKSNLGEIECVDVNQCANKLREEYHQQPSIIVLDSHYEEQLSEVPIYERVALGGTFDNMHYGHCKLLTLSALACSKQLIIGITGDSMLADKSNAAMITDFATRSSAVSSFIKAIKPTIDLHIAELAEPFGPAITDPDITAIVVSSETIRGAFKINAIRVGKGMKPLAVLVTYRTDSVVLSSTFIREKKQLQMWRREL